MEQTEAPGSKKRKALADPEAIHECNEEIISINAGGEILHTTRATLTAYPDSILTPMFSGDWKKTLKRDGLGNIWIDCDGAVFRYLLQRLRRGDVNEEEPPSTTVCHTTDQWKQELMFWGLYTPPSPKKKGKTDIDQAIPDTLAREAWALIVKEWHVGSAKSKGQQTMEICLDDNCNFSLSTGISLYAFITFGGKNLQKQLKSLIPSASVAIKHIAPTKRLWRHTKMTVDISSAKLEKPALSSPSLLHT